MISDCNPMTYILTKKMLGGKYSKWIFILQEFDLEFEKSKSKKSWYSLNLCVTSQVLTQKLWQKIRSRMNLCFLSVPSILGMEISSFISKPKFFGLNSHDHNDEKSISSLSNIILLVTHYTVVLRTLFFDVVSLLTKLKRF